MVATLIVFIVLVTVVLVTGAALLRARLQPPRLAAPGRHPALQRAQGRGMAPTMTLDDHGTPGPASSRRRGILDRLRSGAAAVIAPGNQRRRARGQLPAAAGFLQTGAFDVRSAAEMVADWPPGLAVVALATGSIGYPSPDAYFVQRNVIAVARGLNGAGVGQRAATLTLSAIITAPFGRTADVAKALRDGAASANRLVRSVAKREPANSDLRTTLDVAHVTFDGDEATLCYAHAGNAAIWLQRAGRARLELLTQAHAVDGGPVLRAVGLTAELTPDIGEVPVGIGDRIFVLTTTPYYALPAEVMKSIVAGYADKPLAECVTALVEAARPAAAPEGITLVAAELSRSPSFRG
jgi:hypothetical protein